MGSNGENATAPDHEVLKYLVRRILADYCGQQIRFKDLAALTFLKVRKTSISQFFGSTWLMQTLQGLETAGALRLSKNGSDTVITPNESVRVEERPDFEERLAEVRAPARPSA